MPPVIMKKSITRLKVEGDSTPKIFKDIPKLSKSSPKKTIFLSVRMPSAEPSTNPTFEDQPA